MEVVGVEWARGAADTAARVHFSTRVKACYVHNAEPVLGSLQRNDNRQRVCFFALNAVTFADFGTQLRQK